MATENGKVCNDMGNIKELDKKDRLGVFSLCGDEIDATLCACIEGMGRLWADDKDHPNYALGIVGDFCFLLGIVGDKEVKDFIYLIKEQCND